ncbi:hypothetical protein [Synechococcus phage Ssp-JY43]|nr:hypothetical protein [Synechococcus phage Yong-M4-251]
MLDGFARLIKSIKVLAEISVFVGIALLIYYWSATISFFPPSLSVGDIAKLLVISAVGAFTFSMLTLYTFCLGAVPLTLILRGTTRLSSSSLSYQCSHLYRTIESTDLRIFPVLGASSIPFFLVLGFVQVSLQLVLGVVVSVLVSLLIVHSVMLKSEVVHFDGNDSLSGFTSPVSSYSLFGGLILGVFSALVVWGGPDAFLFATMKQAGVMSLDQDVFVEKKYCPLLGDTFDLKYADNHCYLKGGDILFQGMGDRVLLANLEKGYRISLPSESLFVVEGFSSVDTLWTPETTKPAQGGLSR